MHNHEEMNMNTYNMTEQEQIQFIKNWLKKYVPSIVLGIAIAFVASWGWRSWQHHKSQQAEQASALYEQLLANDNTQQPQMFTQLANNLQTNFSRTPYAALSGLLQARLAVDQGNLDLAHQKLVWVINNSKDQQIKDIAKMRSARVLMAQNKYQDALGLLETIQNKNYEVGIQIVKGDIYSVMGNVGEAKSAYQTALNNLPANAAIRPMVQMKLDNLAG